LPGRRIEDSDEEITGVNLAESSISSPLKAILVITELTDVFPKDNTPNLPEVAPIITEYVAVFSEDLPNKLPSMRDIRHAIELIPGAYLPDLSHPRLDPTKQTELK